jgi:hypothetical protein
MNNTYFASSASFLADAGTFRKQAAAFITQAMRMTPRDDFDLRIALEYERLARSAEDAAFLFGGLENAPPGPSGDVV